ncbi:hypothetical protein [Rhizobium terrae]|uniref:hypothetical protein n=1 Tax=Rhizobium terrae TaxID=2171756 RepID=UPI000E3CCC8F|nr:hypothetical protein [Rhizobium terrae]
MKKLLIVLAQALVLALLPAFALAQQQIVSDPEIYEKNHFREECKIAQFDADFIKRFDINNDGIIDLVSDQSRLVCDGKRGPACNAEGCPYNFYVQVKEGGYVMVATAKLYRYDFVQYFGNMVFNLTMHPRYCGRTDAVPCEMRVRVRGLDFNILSKK